MIEGRDFLTRFDLRKREAADPSWATKESSTSKGREKGSVTERLEEMDGLGARLDPEVRSWIENVIVPAMVREFIADYGTATGVAEPIAAVRQCKANVRLSAEGIQ